MVPLRSMPMKYLSYLTISVAGGLAAMLLGPPVSPGPTVDGLAEHSSGTSPRKDGRALLDDFIASNPYVGMGASRSKAVSALEEFQKRSATMAPSEDPEADFKTLLAKYESMEEGARNATELLPELGATLAQWMERDGAGALGFLAGSYQRNGATGLVAKEFLPMLAKGYVARHGWRALLQAVSGQDDLIALTAPAVFDDLAKKADRESVGNFKAICPKWLGNGEAGSLLAAKWPLEKKEELLAILDPESAAEAMATIAGRMQDKQGAEWILDKLRNGEVSEELRAAMADGELGSYYSTIKGATLEQRLAIMDSLGTLKEMGADRTKNEMIYASLRNCFDSDESSDTLYALRHGAMTAAEVVETASRDTPDPGKHRGEYNSQMYRTLAEENVDAADELLAGMSEQEKAKQKVYAARWWFRSTNPNEFYQLVGGLDTSTDPGLGAMLQEAWNDKARGNVSRYGEAYLDWIESLPEGPAKTMALGSIRFSGNAALSNKAAEILKSKP